jgi:single-strand DNA-binding protein
LSPRPKGKRETENIIMDRKDYSIMNGLNKIILIGNLTDTPSVTQVGNGNKLAFRMAVNDSEHWTDKDGNAKSRDTTEFVNCISFVPGVSKFGAHLRKGERVLVEGKLSQRSYEKDGQTHYVTEVKVVELSSMSPKPKADQAA